MVFPSLIENPKNKAIEYIRHNQLKVMWQVGKPVIAFLGDTSKIGSPATH